MRRYVLSNILGLTGAVIGGLLGFLAYSWAVRTQGMYALVVPGGFLGLGCGLLAGHRSLPRGIVCAAAALALGLFAEWKEFPFRKDPSLGFFVRNLGELRAITWLMIAVGTVIAFWSGRDHFGAIWDLARRPAPAGDLDRAK